MTNEYNPDGKEIRFIDSHYKDLFHIPDGSCVQIHYPDETVVKPCTFIDEYHTQIGYNVFHICQFAEIMERNGASYMPEPEIMGDEAAWKVGKDRILAVQTCEDGYDYHQTLPFLESRASWRFSYAGQRVLIHVRLRYVPGYRSHCDLSRYSSVWTGNRRSPSISSVNRNNGF